MAKRQINALLAKKRVLPGLQFGDPVIGEPGRAAPYDHVAVPDRELAHGAPRRFSPPNWKIAGSPSDRETIGCE